MEKVIFISISESEIKNIVQNAVREAVGNANTQIADENPLTFKEAMDYLGYSRSHGYKLTSKNQIPHSKRGKQLYFSKSELDQWLLSNKVKTTKELDQEAAQMLKSKGLKR